MTTIKVRVNPENPNQIAILRPYIDYAHDGGRVSYFNPTDPDYQQLVPTDRAEAWPEVEVEIPLPERVFVPGDVVESRGVRVVRCDYTWFNALEGNFAGGDCTIRNVGYKYIGNVNSI